MRTILFIAALTAALIAPSTALAGGGGSVATSATMFIGDDAKNTDEPVDTTQAPSAPADDDNCKKDEPVPAPAEDDKPATAVMTCDQVEAQISLFETLRKQCQQATDNGQTCDKEEVEEVLTFSEEVRNGMRAEWRRADAKDRAKWAKEIARLDEANAGIKAELALQAERDAGQDEQISVLTQNMRDFIAKSAENWAKQAERDQAQDEQIAAAKRKAQSALDIIRGKVLQIDQNTEDIGEHDTVIRQVQEQANRTEAAINRFQVYFVASAAIGFRAGLLSSDSKFEEEFIKGETIKVTGSDLIPSVGVGYCVKRFCSEASFIIQGMALNAPLSGFGGEFKVGGVLDPLRQRFTFGFGAMYTSQTWDLTGSVYNADYVNAGIFAYTDIALFRTSGGAVQGEVEPYIGVVGSKWTQGIESSKPYPTVIGGIRIRLRARITSRTKNAPALYGPLDAN